MPSSHSTHPLKLILLIVLMLTPLALSQSETQAQEGWIRSPNLGLNHISAPHDPIPDQRYQNALLLGAGWNRWPLYWNMVEPTPGSFDWSGYDPLVANDVRYGLHTNAILLGIPAHHFESGAMRGLNEPVFSDGSDIPGEGKTINPNNPYAGFVYQAVMRYKPGGTLAAQLGWQPTEGIRVWEAWNEPDLSMFWSGTVQQYARLLKVTYMAVRQADTLAQVMFAGLAYNDPHWNDYLARTLMLIQRDPLRDAYHWFFDIAAVHTYTNPDRTWGQVRWMKQVLGAYGLDRPVWVNESGVPVWDDYPGPTWAASAPGNRQYRGTQQEQALYMIKSTALAWAGGADKVFIFQLYDDCGNQPSGTNFAPESGQGGDAYGLFRNDRTAACHTQSAQPNTPRPAASAFYRMAQVFGERRFDGATRVNLYNRGTALVFDLSPMQGMAGFGPVTGGSVSNISERATVMWNDSRNRLVVEIPASGQSAVLYDMHRTEYRLTPENGRYVIGLPPVEASDYPQLAWSEVARVSGAPYILVEQIQQGDTLIDPWTIMVQGSNLPLTALAAVPTAAVTPGAVFVPTAVPTLAPPTPLAQPTTDPAFDRAAPVPVMAALPETSPPSFAVQWSGVDDGGIAGYLVWVRVNSGNWEKWLETPESGAVYAGAAGNTYEFALWAVDLAGNWSENIDIVPQAVTTVQ